MSEQFDKDWPDKDLPDEQQFEEYLRGGSDVSRQYRQLRGADVPAELDNLVLRRAREAVKARPAKSRTWMRWAGPVALAASAVLVVSIVIESGVHEENYLTVPASAPIETAAKQEAAEKPASRDKAAAGNAADSSVVHVMPISPEAVPEMAMVEVPEPDMPAEAPAAFQDRAISPAAPSPAPVAPQFAPAQPQTETETPATELGRRDRADAAAQTSARTSAPAPGTVSQRVEVPEEDTRLEEIIMTGQKRREQKQTAGPRNTVVAAPAATDSASGAAEHEDESRNYSDPEQWLRDIRQLRKENKHEEADREWRRFRHVFPNHEVADSDSARGALR